MRWILAIVAAAACGSDRAPARAANAPDALAEELRSLVGASEAARRAAVDGWRLDERVWRQTVVPTYHALYADYARGFSDAAAPIVRQLATPGAITARRHFANDPRLTHGQARLRWAVPTLYPSAVAELAGAPIDAIFVHDGVGWRALIGLDAIVLARVRARDAACGDLLARAGPAGRCTEIGWAIADTALRDDAAGFTHACRLAAVHCANAPP